MKLNGNKPLEVEVKKEEEKKTADNLILGLVPSFNTFFLRGAFHAIEDYLKEFAILLNEEYIKHIIWQDLYYGRSQLYLGYIDKSEKALDEKNYQMLVLEHLQKPKENFAGYALIRINEDAFYINAIWTNICFAKPAQEFLDKTIDAIIEKIKKGDEKHEIKKLYKHYFS